MTDSLLGLFDKGKSGEICFSEFGALWRYVVDWQNCFKAFDKYLHFLTCRVLIKKCLQSARFAQEEMKNKRCFPQGQVRNDKPIWVARSPHHFRLQPESSGAQTVKSQQFTWKSLRLCVLKGVFSGVPSSATQVWQNRSKRCVLRRLHPVLSCHAGSLLFDNQWKEEA